MLIRSKSGRSVDVRRIYHRETRETFIKDRTRTPMKRWARDFTNNQTVDMPLRQLVGAWLVGKGVEVYA